ncbi:amino acid ABC transporter permease [Desertihabitans brevis]|uniref:Amino acid ABC transporter permease n=1 Tax=Desertihabitans brevis TaxID=2268447 RepID=A0A367YZS6_9ACTN|nr:amino acid ABC transporter permease [Desertihabitans brevis]RCK71396.1 amino acid ABC transporter permease [Desertihabitans brevis]
MTSVLYDSPGPRAIRRSRIVGVVGTLAIIALLGWALWSMYSRGLFDDRWEIFVDPPKGQEAADVWSALLIRGLGATLLAGVIAAPIALLLGTLGVSLRRSTLRPVRWATTVVIELFRGLPVVLMMFFILLVFGVSPLWAVVAGLVLYNTAIFAEILRAGLAALPRGQREAALAVGMTPLQSFLSVELPQAVRLMVPSLVSQLVVLLKDSSLGFIVGYAELLRTIRLNSSFFGPDTLVPYFFVGAAIYIGLNLALSRLAVWLERRGGSRRTAKETPVATSSATAAGPDN